MDISVDFQKIRIENKITDDESYNIKSGLPQSVNRILCAEECHFIGKREISLKSSEIKEEEKRW